MYISNKINVNLGQGSETKCELGVFSSTGPKQIN